MNKIAKLALSYRFATKRVRIGVRAAGTAARKLLKIRALLVFSTTYAFFAFNLLNAILVSVVFAALPLLAQGAWGNMDPPISREPFINFKALLSSSAMSLVVFDTGQGEWRGDFEKLAVTGRLSELPLVFRVAGVGAAVELYQREGWAQGPRWALMDWNAKVHSSSDAIPDPKTLLDALDLCNAKTSVQRLRDFVALNPDSVEGRKTLLLKLAQIANRRTAAALNLGKNTRMDPDKPRISMGDDTGFTLSNVPLEDEYAAVPSETRLDSDQDSAIWGEYLAELSKLLGDDRWVALYVREYYKVPERASLVPPLARYSPLCQAAFAKHLPAVEALLKKLPSHGAAWQAWIGLADASRRDLFKASDKLLSELEPLTWATLDWPPPQLHVALLKRAIADQDWRRVIKYGGERWDAVLTVVLADNKYSKNKPPFVPSFMNEYLWRSLAGPLLEAHLATGDIKKAEDIMDYWKLCNGWEGAYGLAAGTAEKYKCAELARTWRQQGQ